MTSAKNEPAFPVVGHWYDDKLGGQLTHGMTTQPEALRLADLAERLHFPTDFHVAAAAELRRLHQHELANDLWNRKTLWVQQSAQAEELGMHRADVLAWRIDKLRAERDALLWALKMIAGTAPCIDNLMGDKDIARAAIAKAEGRP